LLFSLFLQLFGTLIATFRIGKIAKMQQIPKKGLCKGSVMDLDKNATANGNKFLHLISLLWCWLHFMTTKGSL
jgi:hypothetical protein